MGAQRLGVDILAHEAATGMRARARREADAAAFAVEVERLLCNVATLHLAGVPDALLAIGTRWNTDSDGSKTRSNLLAAAESLGLIDCEARGHIAADGKRIPTLWRAKLAMLDYLPHALALSDLELVRQARSFVVIRGDAGRRLPLPPKGVAMNATMAELNEWMHSLPLTLESAGTEAWLTRPSDYGLPAIATAQHVELVRTFRGSLAEGGRMYGTGFWINAPAEWRAAHIRLAGERIAECDFSAINLRLAYHQHGLPWPFADADAYTAGAGARDGWKKVTNAALRAKAPLRQWPGKTREEQSLHRDFFPHGARFPGVMAAIRRHHPALDALGAFGRGLGGAFERTESDIAVASLTACRARGLPALPLHDCLIVPASRAAEAAGLMEGAALQVAGVELPVSWIRPDGLAASRECGGRRRSSPSLRHP